MILLPKHRFTKILTSCVLLSFISCSTMHLDKYQEPDFPVYEESSETPGLMMFATPMLDDNASKKCFGVKLLENNILAIYLSVKNRNSDHSYLIRAESIRLTESDSSHAIDRPEKGDKDAARGAAAGLAVGTILVSPLLLSVFLPVLAQQLSDASIVEENFETSKFRTNTLEFGEKANGFVYFAWDGVKEYSNVNLCLELSEGASNEKHQPCINVSLRRENNE